MVFWIRNFVCWNPHFPKESDCEWCTKSKFCVNGSLKWPTKFDLRFANLFYHTVSCKILDNGHTYHMWIHSLYVKQKEHFFIKSILMSPRLNPFLFVERMQKTKFINLPFLKELARPMLDCGTYYLCLYLCLFRNLSRRIFSYRWNICNQVCMISMSRNKTVLKNLENIAF